MASNLDSLLPKDLHPDDRVRAKGMLSRQMKKSKAKSKKSDLPPELEQYKDNMSPNLLKILNGEDKSLGAGRDPSWKMDFINGLRNTANIRLACQLAGVSRIVALRERDNDAEFAEMWDMAMEDAVDLLEATAYKKAREGSEYLLTFLLKSLRPHIYRENYNNTKSQDGSTLIEIMKACAASNAFPKTDYLDADVNYEESDTAEMKKRLESRLEYKNVSEEEYD